MRSGRFRKRTRLIASKGRRESRVRKFAAPVRIPPPPPPPASRRQPPSAQPPIFSYDLLFRRDLRSRVRLLRLRQRNIPVDVSDRDARAARPDAGAVAPVALLVFALLEVRQVGFDSAVVAARFDVGVDFADEAKSGVAVDVVYVNLPPRRELGDGRLNPAVDVSE